MDNIIETNRERWDAMAGANIMFSQPFLDFTREQAVEFVYRDNILTDVAGKEVLCLAGSGGQDSVAFGLLGAKVTVFDLSDVQLSRDRDAAAHHGLMVETVQGDMRDLSVFADDRFDVVWQPYSVNYSPAVEHVFKEVARVLKPGGIYYVSIANPFILAINNDWDGNGYPLRGLYTDGEDISRYYPAWELEQPDGSVITVERPHEFRHTLSTVFNTLAKHGFIFLHLYEWMRDDENPETGSWAHFTQSIPPYLYTYWRLIE